MQSWFWKQFENNYKNTFVFNFSHWTNQQIYDYLGFNIYFYSYLRRLLKASKDFCLSNRKINYKYIFFQLWMMP